MGPVGAYYYFAFDLVLTIFDIFVLHYGFLNFTKFTFFKNN